ncbi:MAG: hypothetical protein AAB036_12135 [Elusimicrobiota bacterium]
MRASLLCFLLAGSFLDRAHAKTPARAGEIFSPPLADPWQSRTAASYFRLGGVDSADLSLGAAAGFGRSRWGRDLSWQSQWEAEAMARARLARNGRTEAADLSAALPVVLRRGDVSFKITPFYRGADSGRPRFHQAGLRTLAALEPSARLRLYAGTSLFVKTSDSPKRWGLQAGGELLSPEFQFSVSPRTRAYLASDIQGYEAAGFNPEVSIAAGLRLARANSRRNARLQAGWHDRRSIYGRFSSRRERWVDFTLVFEP